MQWWCRIGACGLLPNGIERTFASARCCGRAGGCLHGMARHGTAWHSMARHGTAWHGTAWHAHYGMARHGMARHGTAWHGMARHGTAWRGMAWHGMAWHGVACTLRPQGDCGGCCGAERMGQRTVCSVVDGQFHIDFTFGPPAAPTVGTARFPVAARAAQLQPLQDLLDRAVSPSVPSHEGAWVSVCVSVCVCVCV